MKDFNTDALIIGSGIAGLSAAIKLAEEKYKVTIITREKRPEVSNTYWAQGGIIYSPKSFNDQEDLVNDINKASSYTSYIEAAKILSVRSAEIIDEMLIRKAHTEFAKSSEGELLFTKEAAHSRERIIYKGDMTGKEIQISMLNYLSDTTKFPNVTFLTSHTAIDLITPNHHGVAITQRYEENQVLGAYVFDQSTSEVRKILSKVTILATGGIGALYLHHSNAEGARGDGHAMAHRAGAHVTNMEFIQFHPTTFYDRSSHRRFLISEAVRGEGGKLINARGEAFMTKYHPDGDMAPRDVVSRAILEEMIADKSDCVYLDITFKSEEYLKHRFPTIHAHCLDNKVDMAKEPIPVVPAAHYTCGGVKTNLSGKTNLKRLYAVGEIACTGLHGANRLASTSLLEGLTWGYIAAEDIISGIKELTNYELGKIKDWTQANEESDMALIAQDQMTLKQTMWNYVGLSRSQNRLARARAMFLELQDEVSRFYKNAKLNDELIGLRNGVEVSFMVLNASSRNKQSVGCFYLKD
ncbi:MAG TPA: FAD-dependent oxidoreductase [Bacteriovoracaceae bacterium]|nr:FAD-dependent oxidoreductase [Bacteriovoracaceae bacterium]